MTGDEFESAARYELPTSFLPGRDLEEFLDTLEDLARSCVGNGLQIKNTRIDRYIRYLSRGLSGEDGADAGIFFDGPDTPIRHTLDRYLYVLREVHELAWAWEGLRSAEVSGLFDRMAKVIGGADFAALDRNPEARNTQFELRIASYFARAGYKIALDSLTDVVATRGGTTFFVECKRVGSGKQLLSRIKEATEQIRRRIPKSTWRKGVHGVVAVDVTKVGFTHNGLTWGVTPQHTKDIIQNKLRSISADIERGRRVLPSAPAVALWLQIHIPAVVMQPPQPISRFSSLYMPNTTMNLRSRFAAEGLWNEIVGVGVNEGKLSSSESLTIRSRLFVPEGTTIAPDGDLIDALLLSAGKLPKLSDEYVVLSVTPPNASDDETEDFSYGELRLAWGQVKESDRLAAAESWNAMVGLVLVSILSFRYPYIGMAPWLDGNAGEDGSDRKSDD